MYPAAYAPYGQHAAPGMYGGHPESLAGLSHHHQPLPSAPHAGWEYGTPPAGGQYAPPHVALGYHAAHPHAPHPAMVSSAGHHVAAGPPGSEAHVMMIPAGAVGGGPPSPPRGAHLSAMMPAVIAATPGSVPGSPQRWRRRRRTRRRRRRRQPGSPGGGAARRRTRAARGHVRAPPAAAGPADPDDQERAGPRRLQPVRFPHPERHDERRPVQRVLPVRPGHFGAHHGRARDRYTHRARARVQRHPISPAPSSSPRRAPGRSLRRPSARSLPLRRAAPRAQADRAASALSRTTTRSRRRTPSR